MKKRRAKKLNDKVNDKMRQSDIDVEPIESVGVRG